MYPILIWITQLLAYISFYNTCNYTTFRILFFLTFVRYLVGLHSFSLILKKNICIPFSMRSSWEKKNEILERNYLGFSNY